MKIVRSEEATVQRVVVQIRMLEVSGRKMSLALFRQIRNESPFDDKGALRGALWGVVRHGDVEHVLWSHDDQLRKWWPGYAYRARADYKVAAETYCWRGGDLPHGSVVQPEWLDIDDLRRWEYLVDKSSFEHDTLIRAAVTKKPAYGDHQTGNRDADHEADRAAVLSWDHAEKSVRAARFTELQALVVKMRDRQHRFCDALADELNRRKAIIAKLEQLYIAG